MTKKLKLKYRFLIIFSAALYLVGCSNTNSVACEGCYAIVNTNIINVENGETDVEMSLIIQDNYIIELGKTINLDIPTNAIIIDGKDKFIIPGLWDMHAHTSSDSITRKIAFPLLIANGVTGIRNMKADCYNEEYPCEKYGETDISTSKKWQREINSGTLVGPRLILGSQFVNGIRNDSSTVLSPGTPEHGKEHVKFLKKRGVDFIKIYDELPKDVFFAIADEAKNQNMIFAGHVPIYLKTSEVAIVGQKSIEHVGEGNLFEECSSIEKDLRKKLIASFNLDNPNIGQIVLEMVKSYDLLKCDAILNILKESGTWFTPTLIVKESQFPYFYNWKVDNRMKYLPKLEKDLWYKWDEDWNSMWGKWDSISESILRNKRFELVNLMHNKGIPLLAGADSAALGVFWGSSIHEELELLVQAGLSENEALKTATINPALYLEKQDSLGAISTGKFADFLILEANPLIDIKNTKKISGVFSNGMFYNRTKIDSLLKTVELNAQKMK